MQGVGFDLSRVNKLARDTFFLYHFSILLFFGYFGDDKFLVRITIPTQDIKIFHSQTKGIHFAVAGGAGRLIAVLVDTVFDGECFRGCFEGPNFKVFRSL